MTISPFFRFFHLSAWAQAGRLGAIGAPGFVFLGSATGAAFLPYIVFGSLILLAGISTPALPETLDAPQPESVQVCKAHPSLACIRS